MEDKERFKSFQEAFSQCLKLGVYEEQHEKQSTFPTWRKVAPDTSDARIMPTGSRLFHFFDTTPQNPGRFLGLKTMIIEISGKCLLPNEAAHFVLLLPAVSILHISRNLLVLMSTLAE